MRKRLQYIVLLGAVALATAACSGKDSAKSYYEAGMESMEKGDYEIANENFKKAIELKEDKAEYYIANGTALLKLGKYEEAIQEFDQAIVDVDSSVTMKNKKKALRAKGIAYSSMGDVDKAIEMFTEAKKIDELKELDEDINAYLADCYVEKEDYTSAIAIYDEMLEENGKLAYVYAMRGKVQALAGDTAKAEEDFNTAISKDEKQYALYSLAYDTLKAVGDTEAANRILDQAKGLSAKTAEDRYYVAKFEYEQGNIVQAIASLNEIAAEYREAYALLGEIYWTQKDYINAIENYTTYIGEHKTGIASKIYYQIADCYVSQKEYERAMEYIQLGMNAADKQYSKELKYEEILVLEYQGNFNEAYEKAKAYVAAYPEDEAMQRELVFLETRYNKK